jgi:hypothetical protein
LRKDREMDKTFVTVWALQEKEIGCHCFDNCGKVIFGLIMDEQIGGLSSCHEEKCPHLEVEITEPFGEVNGQNVYLRKLKPCPKDGE